MIGGSSIGVVLENNVDVGPTPHTAAAVAGATAAVLALVFGRFRVGAVPLAVVALFRFRPFLSVVPVLTTSAVVF